MWQLCQRLLRGGSVKAAAEELRLPFALETVCHLLTRLRHRLDVLRSWLCRSGKAPESSRQEPWLQTMEHLQGIFREAVCPVSEFQAVFQQPFMG